MSKKDSKAFTLIEITIMLGVIVIFVGISWAALNSAKKNIDAGNACTQVAAMINKTRNYTLSGKTTEATVEIRSGSQIIVTGSGIPQEDYSIKGGVSCDNISPINYHAPDGRGGTTANINCHVSGGAIKIVEVTPYNAVCK